MRWALVIFQPVGQPIESLVEAFPICGTGSLDVPLSVAQGVKTQLVCDLRCRHGIGQVLSRPHWKAIIGKETWSECSGNKSLGRQIQISGWKRTFGFVLMSICGYWIYSTLYLYLTFMRFYWVFNVCENAHVDGSRSTILSGRRLTCLLAKTNSKAPLSSSSANILMSSSRASEHRSRSLLSTTKMRPVAETHLRRGTQIPMIKPHHRREHLVWRGVHTRW